LDFLVCPARRRKLGGSIGLNRLDSSLRTERRRDSGASGVSNRFARIPIDRTESGRLRRRAPKRSRHSLALARDSRARNFRRASGAFHRLADSQRTFDRSVTPQSALLFRALRGCASFFGGEAAESAAIPGRIPREKVDGDQPANIGESTY
jgi:hypothetical protein